jgi:integrase
MRGSIVVRKSRRDNKPLYYVVLQGKWHTVPGKQTKANADRYCGELIARFHKGERLEIEQIAFDEFTEKWFDNVAGGLSVNTQGTYRVWLRNQLLPFFGSQPVSSITVEDVQRLNATLLQDLAPQSVKSCLHLMRQLCRFAFDWGYARTNVAEKVRMPRIPPKEMGYLTAQEVGLFLAEAPNHSYYTLFLTAVTTGMRISEIVAMKWHNIDWNASKYHVRESYSYVPKEKGLKEPKTVGSYASVDLSPACLEALRTHRSEQTASPESEDNDLVFPNATGHVIDPSTVVRRYFHKMLDKAGLRRIRFHDLRHTTATLLLSQGEPIKYVQRQLRHSSAQTTLDRYAHVLPDQPRDATRRLDDAIFGG